MKNTRKVLGIIALIAIIGLSALSMTGCQEPEATTITSVDIKTPPTVNEYEVGDSLNTEGLVVKVTYSNGTSEEITAGFQTVGFDSLTKGTKNVFIIFNGKTSASSFPVTVIPKVVSITAVVTPLDKLFAIDEKLEAKNITVTAVVTDLETPTIEIKNFTIGDFDSSTVGVKDVKITYKTFETTLKVTVNAFVIAEPVALPVAGTYITPQSVTLAVLPPPVDADIYYTIDGTEPTAATGTKYTGEISISATTTLKAIGIKDGWTNSSILEAKYTIYTPIDMPVADKWYDGSLSSTVKEQWFKFTATAATQYIHFQPGVLTSATVQLYKADGTTTEGASAYLSSSSTNISRTGLTADTVYYIKVTTTSIFPGAYKIAFNTTSSSPTIVTIPTTGVTELTVGGKWTDGNIPDVGGEQWFKFTATAATHYIHFLKGSMFNVNVQLYTTEGRTQGSSSSFSYSSYASQTGLTASTVYYIKVTPYSSTASGTYRIGVNTSSTRPSITIPNTGVTTLTNNTWADGNITSTVYEQWFTFTAGGASTYIHFLPDALTDVYVQLYDNSGVPVSTNAYLNPSTVSVSRSTTASGTYYILLQPYSSSYSGAYKIAYGNSSTQPAIPVPNTGVIDLTADTWVDGNISTAGGEQWFKFKATATSHYIHFLPGTGTGALTAVYVRLFVQAGTNVGDTSDLNSNTHSVNKTGLTANTDYYIRVTPNSNIGSGAYKIGFNTTAATPILAAVPSTGFVDLTLDVFSDGNIAAAGGEQWFKFTSTATTQYIHFDSSGTLSDVYVQLYTSDGRLLGDRTNLYSLTPSISRTVTNSTVYYIKVTPYSTTGKGAYKIGFNTSTTKPRIKITLPTTEVPSLSADTWGNGNITTAGGEQWFKFVATATPQYIHFLPGLKASGGLNDVNIQLYDNTGISVGSQNELYDISGQAKNLNRSVTVGQTYYIKVWPYYSSAQTGSLANYSHIGTYKIAFNTTTTAPTVTP